MMTSTAATPRFAYVDYERLLREQAALARDFASAEPYAHVTIDAFLRPEIAAAVLAEFREAAGDWTYLHHVNEKKRQLTDRLSFGPVTQRVVAELQSREFVEFLEELTGIRALFADPELEGSGLHEVRTGGFLNMHVDFLSHVIQKRWSRQLNLLVYLNEGWDEKWGGHFELWNRDMTACVKKIAPLFNRCVIFKTSEISWHGHPAPLTCPPEQSRKSLALYYYRDEGATVQLSATDYRPTPGDGPMKRMLIAVDSVMLKVYSLLKRYAGLRDGLINRILKHF